MNFLRITQALESILLEMILLVLFLPKTLIKVITHPSWIPPYLETELNREDDERFNQYSSPMATFLFLGAIPVFIVYAYSSGESLSIPFIRGSNQYTLSVTEFFVFTSFILLIGPLYMSIVYLVLLKRPFEKKEFRYLMQIQAYLWTVPYCIYGIASLTSHIRHSDEILNLAIEETLIPFTLGFIWMLFANTVLMRIQLNRSLPVSFAIVLVAIAIYLTGFFFTGEFIEASLRN